jgi:hypothetical protein
LSREGFNLANNSHALLLFRRRPLHQSRCVLSMNVDTAARSLAETLKLSRRKMADEDRQSLNQHHLTSPAASNYRGETARLGPGHGAIAVLSLRAGRGRDTGYHLNGSIRYAAGPTIAARVLSTKALTSACSAAGTENLSSLHVVHERLPFAGSDRHIAVGLLHAAA